MLPTSFAAANDWQVLTMTARLPEGFEPMDEPEMKVRNQFHPSNIVNYFLACGVNSIGRDYGNRETAKKAYASLNQYVKRNDSPCRVWMRGTVVGIADVREGVDDE